MENKPNNPSAFPVPASNAEYGMDLRDYFAAKAMQGLITATDSEGNWTGFIPKDLAENSYGVADAMLKQREI